MPWGSIVLGRGGEGEGTGEKGRMGRRVRRGRREGEVRRTKGRDICG